MPWHAAAISTLLPMVHRRRAIALGAEAHVAGGSGRLAPILSEKLGLKAGPLVNPFALGRAWPHQPHGPPSRMFMLGTRAGGPRFQSVKPSGVATRGSPGDGGVRP